MIMSQSPGVLMCTTQRLNRRGLLVCVKTVPHRRFLRAMLPQPCKPQPCRESVRLKWAAPCPCLTVSISSSRQGIPVWCSSPLLLSFTNSEVHSSQLNMVWCSMNPLLPSLTVSISSGRQCRPIWSSSPLLFRFTSSAVRSSQLNRVWCSINPLLPRLTAISISIPGLSQKLRCPRCRLSTSPHSCKTCCSLCSAVLSWQTSVHVTWNWWSNQGWGRLMPVLYQTHSRSVFL